MVFHTRNSSGIRGLPNDWRFSYEKVMECPWCGVGTDGMQSSVMYTTYGEKNIFLALNYRCTACGKYYVATYDWDRISTDAIFLKVLPEPTAQPPSAQLVELSPRFAEMHMQAASAASNGHLDLAAIGFRSALELIVKDYGIKELHCDPAKAGQMKLADAIAAFLHQENLLNCADVVRMLGNDYAHYCRKYSNIDFDTLKVYYDIFLSCINTALLAAHPPVSRHRQASNAEP